MTMFTRIPDSITFGFKVLEIPSLDEMGIPMAGLGFCRLADGLDSYPYNPTKCWVPRGAPILSYVFHYYRNAVRSRLYPLMGDPRETETFEIRSPISGMLLINRNEFTLGGVPGLSLQYEWCDEPRLPVLLVPNDEPPADTHNFYVYDRIAEFVSRHFDMLPYRDRSSTTPERLGEWLVKRGAESATTYNQRKETISNRKHDDFRKHRIREITQNDHEVIGKVQAMRGKDVALRDKLVHLSRKFSESV
jgi:hypothetical protein